VKHDINETHLKAKIKLTSMLILLNEEPGADPFQINTKPES
jgi:hypothetical protein